MLLVDDLAAGGTKNLRHTPRGLVTLLKVESKLNHNLSSEFVCHSGVKEGGNLRLI